ncbi:MAG: fibronectin type III-like domain-contianing protein, partial [Muribaculaceae bacterium]|nr:fibronectin type III-like domain-contianing protein [Muribaculaceae bacterium]
PFGYGLSYTTFSFGEPEYADGRLTVDVTNTGSRAGTEVVQVYIRRPDDPEGPDKTLRGYALAELQPGETRTVTVDMPRSAFEVWDASAGEMRVRPGRYDVMVGSSSADGSLRTISVDMPD